MTLESRTRINFVQTSLELITTDCSLPVRAMRKWARKTVPATALAAAPLMDGSNQTTT
jgi:hypothetical protein